MANEFDPDSLAPNAPGYILAPTTFRLKGTPDDFVDWDETTGSPEDDYWADEPNYWLLVFRAYSETEKPSRWVRLEAEISVDVSGQHRCVALGKHWGEDRRPIPQQFSRSAIVHPWGWRYPKSSKNPYDLFPHWILASPFQLAWKSLPPMSSEDRSCDWTTFEKWASQRGLEHTLVTLEELQRGEVSVAVASTWQEGFARNRALLGAVDQARPRPQQLKERLLYNLVNFVLHRNTMVPPEQRSKEFDVLPFLRKGEFDAFGERLDVEDRQASDKLIRESVRFKSFLKSKQWAAIQRDAEASQDPMAHNTLLAIMGRVICGSTEAPAVLPALKDDAEKARAYLERHFDGKSGFRAFRKAAKSFWYLAKTYVEVGQMTSGIPQWLVDASQVFARKWFDTELRPVQTQQGGPKLFSPEDVASLKAKSTGSLAHLRFYVFLEAANVAYAVKDLSEKKSGGELAKKTIYLTGALASAVSSYADYAKVKYKDLANKGRVGKFLAHRATTRALGIASSAVDAVVGGWAVLTDVETQDYTAAKFHGVQAGAGLLSMAGYICLLCATGGLAAPFGALCVLVGCALGMGASMGASMFKSSDMQNWVKFCRWGVLAGKDDVGIEPKDWAGGPPRDLHLLLDREIRTLNALLVGLRVELTMAYDPNRPMVEIAVFANMIADEGCIHLELMVEGVRMRKMSLWKRGKERGPDGAFREKFSLGESTRVTVRVRADLLGGGRFWHPQDPHRPLEVSETLSPPSIFTRGRLAEIT